MRVRRIHIKSFGTLTNWHSGDLGDGVTLVYGDNETGKTTITEFVRGTLFPSRGQKYPSYDKSDSGTIVVEMDDGERRIYERKGRRTSEQDGKPLPGEEFSLDSNTYTSLYAMGLEQLTNAKIIAGGEFRSRFLTVPGGENIPAISEEIQKEMLNIMNRERLTSTKGIGKTLAELKEAENGIARAKADADEFDDIFSRKKELEAKAGELRLKNELSQNEEMRRGVISSQRENLERLDALEAEIETLTASKVPSEDITEYSKLKSKAADTLERLDVAEGKVPPPELEGRSVDLVISMAEDIETAWQSKSRVEVLQQQLADMEEEVEERERIISDYTSSTGWTEKATMSADSGMEVIERAEMEEASTSFLDLRFVSITMMVLGTILFVLGMVSILELLPISLNAAVFIFVAGAVVLLFGAYLLKVRPTVTSDWDVWIEARGYPRGTTAHQVCLLAPKLEMIKGSAKRRNELKINISETVATISEVSALSNRPAQALGLEGLPFKEAVDKMYSLLNAARKHTGEANVPLLKAEARNAESNLKKFLADRGGEEEFAKAVRNTEALGIAKKDAASLIASMESSSKLSMAELRKIIFDTGESHPESIASISEELDGVNRSIGELDARMASILDDGDVNAARVRKAATEARLLSESKRWATLSLADHMISRAAGHFYKDLQPEVVKLANVYLGAMTDGRYTLDDDPREKELCIWDGYSKKGPSQWSSGLGDQVYLSVKMAIARCMTKESMPMILDDVLVRFDKKRKQGAAKAIVEFAKDRQVIIFTCDKQLYPLFALEGRVGLIELS